VVVMMLFSAGVEFTSFQRIWIDDVMRRVVCGNVDTFCNYLGLRFCILMMGSLQYEGISD